MCRWAGLGGRRETVRDGDQHGWGPGAAVVVMLTSFVLFQ